MYILPVTTILVRLTAVVIQALAVMAKIVNV